VTEEAGDFWTRALRALDTAKTIVKSDPDASASRSHYAAFYAVAAWLALRNTGDYGGRLHVNQAEAESAVQRAQEIVEVVASLLRIKT